MFSGKCSRLVRGMLLTVSAALLWTLPATAAETKKSDMQTVRVAAASDLKFALDEFAGTFRRNHPKVDLQITYGSSGNFYTQLNNKGPFDVYLSADIDYPKKLIDSGIAAKDSLFSYAIGRLVIWVPKGSNIDVQKLGMEALRHPKARKIAIANPQHAPYGRAAEAAMKTAKVYDAVKGNLVLGDNIAQTAQFVESGAADVGVIALSLAIAPAMKDKGKFWEIPIDQYPRIEQGGAILSWAQSREAAESFKSSLTSLEGKNLLKKYGFFMPNDTDLKAEWTGQPSKSH